MQGLGDEGRVEDELPSALQSSCDGFQELEVPLVGEIAEAVSETERAIELRVPGEVSHLARLEDGLEAALSRLRPGFLDELRGEIGPHDLQPAGGELQGEAAVAAGDVQDPQGAGGPEGLHEKIGLLTGDLLRVEAHPGVEDDPGEESRPPFALGGHVSRPSRVVPEVGVEPTRGLRRSRV